MFILNNLSSYDSNFNNKKKKEELSLRSIVKI